MTRIITHFMTHSKPVFGQEWSGNKNTKTQLTSTVKDRSDAAGPLSFRLSADLAVKAHQPFRGKKNHPQ